MFTGLIEEVGKIVKIEISGSSAQLVVSALYVIEGSRLGDSIAVNGACLTIVSIGNNILTFDVSPETIARTGLRKLKPGSPVNLERALRLSDRLGGHIVTGHVDCVATVGGRRDTSGHILFSFRVPEQNCRYLVEKGSVTVNGVSLTVNEVLEGGFSVNVIPHTAESTNLLQMRIGDEVNIEVDILGKYVERLLQGSPQENSRGLTMEVLTKNGFI